MRYWFVHPESDCHFVEDENFDFELDGCEQIGEAHNESEEDFQRALKEAKEESL